MNQNAIAQVASFLNVSPNQIKRCEEWASVLFVQVHGFRPRFVSKKVVVEMQPKTFSGKWYPGMPDFSDPCEEFEWLERYEAANGLAEPDLDSIIGEIAKYLPMGANPSESNLIGKAQQVADGSLTAQEAANQLSNKKIIIKKR